MRLVEVVLEDNFYDLEDRMMLKVLLVGRVGEAVRIPNLSNPVEPSRRTTVNDIHELHDQLVLRIQLHFRIGLEVVDLIDGGHQTRIAEVLVIVGVLVDLHEVVKKKMFAKMVKRNDQGHALMLYDR